MKSNNQLIFQTVIYDNTYGISLNFNFQWNLILVQGMWNVFCIGAIMEEAFISFTSHKEATTMGLL